VAESFASSAALLERLVPRRCRRRAFPRIVTFFTNGSFDGIIDRFAAVAGV